MAHQKPRRFRGQIRPWVGPGTDPHRCPIGAADRQIADTGRFGKIGKIQVVPDFIDERGGTRGADQDPLAGLGDLPLILELKLQLFNYLGQPLYCKGVCGLQREPAGLLQLSFQYYAPHACHLGAPLCPEFSKMCIDTLTIR
jgi:hypothetical protein